MFSVLASMGVTACDDVIDVRGNIAIDDSQIAVGEELGFSLQLPASRMTRTEKSDWQAELEKYKVMAENYSPITIKMIKKESNPEISFTGQYKPIADDDGEYDSQGNLDAITPLYWQDNVNEWGFEATAGKHEIDTDQSDADKFFAQDYIKGYGYLPLWRDADAEAGIEAGPAYELEDINYRTSKQWYADHKELLSGQMTDLTDAQRVAEYKKIPLWMRHQHAWITIKLKAGDGVNRQALNYQTREQKLEPSIYSYGDASDPLVINKPLASEWFVNYEADKNGPAENMVSSVQYDAIVEPHNYLANPEEDMIMSVKVSGLRFTFAARNDKDYNEYAELTDDAARLAHRMQAYNLTAGKHLTIEARLTSNRLVFITAWVVDWEETISTTICDDFGQNGDPFVIRYKKQFEDFLSDETQNKGGNVAIFQSTELDLDSAYVWPGTYNLNAMLNMAGSTVKTSQRLFQNMSSSASVINGTVELKNDLSDNPAAVDAAIAQTSDGTLERVNVTIAEGSSAKATKGGLVVTNHGKIMHCTSVLPVQGETGTQYVGGIAAESVKNGTLSPIIDGCWVNARVDGAEGVKGGGIVGNAAGQVTNNTFEYGITISQKGENFKNIFATADSQTQVNGNSWPTLALNGIGEGNVNQTPFDSRYDAVIDSQTELGLLLDPQYNAKDKKYRLSADFVVDGTTWNYGQKDKIVDAGKDEKEVLRGNVLFDLNGNNKTITLTGNKSVSLPAVNGEPSGTTVTTAPMLFSNITGSVSNLVLYLDKPVVATPGQNADDVLQATDAIAPLAYNLCGGSLRNVYVTASSDAYVQAGTPAGLVVWASKGATIEDCHVDVPVRMWLPQSTGVQSYHFAGGLVACGSRVSIVDSQYRGSVGLSGYDPSLQVVPQKANFWYFGGLVGGLVRYEDASNISETPELAIIDCSSWYNAALNSDNSTMGSIIGLSGYSDTSSNIVNGMAAGNTGNWWQGKGVATTAGGLTEAQAIGKKSSVTPTFVEPSTEN